MAANFPFRLLTTAEAQEGAGAKGRQENDMQCSRARLLGVDELLIDPGTKRSVRSAHIYKDGTAQSLI